MQILRRIWTELLSGFPHFLPQQLSSINIYFTLPCKILVHYPFEGNYLMVLVKI